LTESYGYDGLYRLTQVGRTGSTTDESFYSYDPVGNRLTTQIGQAVTQSIHDAGNRLLSTVGGGSLRVRGHLDEAGTATVNGQPARMLPGNAFDATINSVPGANTVTVTATDLGGNATTKSWTANVPTASVAYGYDSNGNLTSKAEGSDIWTYAWDAENRLKRVLKNAAEVASFAYDPLGRRVEKVAGGVTSTWTYDGEDILREISGTTTLKYVHGPGIDEPLAQEDGAGALSFFQADGLGSIVKTTNSIGTVTATRRYDSFGNLEVGANNGYSYTGREWDAETGLAYYRARYYDPKIGRFISEDPLRFIVGTNFYPYVENRPTNSRDPLGLAPDDPPFPPTFPPAPNMPGKCPDKRNCNPVEIQNAMASTFTQIRRMYAGQQPSGTMIGGAIGTVATRSGQWMTPWALPPDQFDPYINPNIKDPCVRHCVRFHEWVHWTDMRKWSLQWTPSAAAIQREYPAYVQELQCLFAFQ